MLSLLVTGGSMLIFYSWLWPDHWVEKAVAIWAIGKEGTIVQCKRNLVLGVEYTFMKGITIFLVICTLFTGGCSHRQTKTVNDYTEGYPRIVNNYDGYAGQGRLIQQVFNQAPQRILAVSAPVIDNLIFLGLQDKIIAVAADGGGRYEPYEKEYAKLYKITENHAYPSKETVLSQKPDFIIGWGSLFGDDALGSVTYWQEKGIHTYAMSNTIPTGVSGLRTVDKVITDLRNISRIFAIENEANERIAGLESRLDKIKRQTRDLPEAARPTAVTIQYVYGNEYFERSYSDLTADIIRQAGGKSLDMGGRQSIEYLIKKNPDMIILIDMQGRSAQASIERLKNNSVLRNVNAVKNNNFFVIEYRAFYCGSFHTIEAVEKLHAFINKQRQ